MGNTPLMRIRSLSQLTGCEVRPACGPKPLTISSGVIVMSGTDPSPVSQILAKAELLNPGGSVKDRVALQILQGSVGSGSLQPGGLITEGTAGEFKD